MTELLLFGYFCSTFCIALMISSIFPFCTSFYLILFPVCYTFVVSLSFHVYICLLIHTNVFIYERLVFFFFFLNSGWAAVVFLRFRCICAECISCKCVMNDWWIYEGKNQRNNTLQSAQNKKKIIKKEYSYGVEAHLFHNSRLLQFFFCCVSVQFSYVSVVVNVERCFLLYFHVFVIILLRLEHVFPLKFPHNERDQTIQVKTVLHLYVSLSQPFVRLVGWLLSSDADTDTFPLKPSNSQNPLKI